MVYNRPSIYDVHTEGEGGRTQEYACGRVSTPCGRPHRKLDPTDITFSRAKKYESFVREFAPNNYCLV